MSNRQSLVEFQKNLSQRLVDAPKRAAVDALLGVSLGSSSWLIKLTDIAEVVPSPPIEIVPWSKSWLLGATNLRGQIFSVVDLAAFVGTDPVSDLQSARLLLINRRVVRGCGLLVHQVLGMRNPAAFSPAPRQHDAPWIRSSWLDTENRRWQELDVGQLTNDPTYLDVAL